MMICTSCGSKIGDDFRFCEFCGMPNAAFFDREIKAPDNHKTAESNLIFPQQKKESENGLKCSKCGFELLEDSLYCDRCGAPVEKEKTDPKEIPTCQKCGKELDSNSLFCDRCGTPVSSKQEKTSAPYCIKCGYELEEGSLFCDRCGARQ